MPIDAKLVLRKGAPHVVFESSTDDLRRAVSFQLKVPAKKATNILYHNIFVFFLNNSNSTAKLKYKILNPVHAALHTVCTLYSIMGLADSKTKPQKCADF